MWGSVITWTLAGLIVAFIMWLAWTGRYPPKTRGQWLTFWAVVGVIVLCAWITGPGGAFR